MKLYLAPIQGMTTAFYRNTFFEIFGGIDAYYAPFIGTTAPGSISPQLFKDLLPERNHGDIRLIPQLLGNNGADFKVFASAITDMGYNEINWNIGCPFPMITGKMKGSGLLPHADRIARFLEVACTGAYTLTVKMRLGLTDYREGLDVIEVLNQYPLGGVIIHARTGKQMYTGSVDTEAFDSLAAACRHEVVYNGDIFSLDDFHRISTRFPGIQTYMLGRGALRDPFLPAAIKGFAREYKNPMDLIRQFHDVLYRHYQTILSGDKHLCDKMKGFWTYMHTYLDADAKLIKRLKKCQTALEYEAITGQLLEVAVWSKEA